MSKNFCVIWRHYKQLSALNIMKLKNIKFGVSPDRFFYLPSINTTGCFLKTIANPI